MALAPVASLRPILHLTRNTHLEITVSSLDKHLNLFFLKNSLKLIRGINETSKGATGKYQDYYQRP